MHKSIIDCNLINNYVLIEILIYLLIAVDTYFMALYKYNYINMMAIMTPAVETLQFDLAKTISQSK